jgi:ferritin-like metal-binding protein YciE
VSHAINHAHNHIHRIDNVFLSFNHENRTIINAVAHIIKTVQKSGIIKNTKYNNALKTIKVNKN